MTSICPGPLFVPDLYPPPDLYLTSINIWPQSTPWTLSDLNQHRTSIHPWPLSDPCQHLTSIHFLPLTTHDLQAPLTSMNIWPLSTPWPLSDLYPPPDLYLTSIPPPLDGEYPPLPAGCRLEGETDRTQQTDTGIHTIYTVLKLNILICICIATEWNIYL